MMLIVLHHYVVNSGLYQILENAPFSYQSVTMIILGGWGKIGINCFVLITGYFMCKSKFSFIKLLKLYTQIIFYTLIIYSIFCITGHEHFQLLKMFSLLFPIHGITDSFVGCFLVFYLLIPFINILINNLNKKQHLIIISILLVFYSILPSIPKFYITFNYVEWFVVIYLIASYIRNYPPPLQKVSWLSHKIWGWFTIALIMIDSCSIIGLEYLRYIGILDKFIPYHFIIDSNKILAVLTAVSSFMFFKDLRIPYSRFINTIGAATFGVLLIHANSDAMRQWLWRETIDCIGHYGSSFIWTVGYTLITTIIIFFICAGIDWFRSNYIEPHYMKYFSRKFQRIKFIQDNSNDRK